MDRRLKKFKTLRAWREAHGYTLQEAAEALNISLTSYFLIERGTRIPKPDAMRRIIARTGVSAAVLARVA